MLDPSLFWTQAPSTCSFSTCKIKKTGCYYAFTGTNIKIVNGKEIHGRLNIDAGYTETICAKCTDSDGTVVTQDSIELKQNSAACNFVKAASPPEILVNNFNNVLDRKSFVAMLAWFTSSVSSCTLNCELKNLGCTDAYSGSYLTVYQNMRIQGRQDIQSGYKENVCVVCTDNKGVSVQEDNMEFK